MLGLTFIGPSACSSVWARNLAFRFIISRHPIFSTWHVFVQKNGWPYSWQYVECLILFGQSPDCPFGNQTTIYGHSLVASSTHAIVLANHLLTVVVVDLFSTRIVNRRCITTRNTWHRISLRYRSCMESQPYGGGRTSATSMLCFPTQRNMDKIWRERYRKSSPELCLQHHSNLDPVD